MTPEEQARLAKLQQAIDNTKAVLDAAQKKLAATKGKR